MRVIGANELRSGALERREGERQVLRLLEEAFEPADTPLNQGNWVAYYGSVIRQLTAPPGNGVKPAEPTAKHLCEVDFLVISRDRGLLLIEVKGGQIRIEDDKTWLSKEPNAGWVPCRDPLSQADEALRALERRAFDALKDGGRAWQHLWRVPTVALPFSTLSNDSWPSGWSPAMVASQAECADVSAFTRWLNGAFDYIGKGLNKMLSIDSAHAARAIEERVIHPRFRADLHVQEQINRLEARDGKAASHYPHIYDFVRSRLRRRSVRVEGAAGTGKTYAGLVRAYELLRRDPQATCLFVCHNRMLAQYVSRSFVSSFGHRFTAMSFESLARDQAKRVGIDLPSPDEVNKMGRAEQAAFYDGLPSVFLSAVGTDRARSGVDPSLVIVDEAQDLSAEKLGAIWSTWSGHAAIWCTYDRAQTIFPIKDGKDSKDGWEAAMARFGDPDVLGTMCRCSIRVVDYLRKQKLLDDPDLEFDPGAPEGLEVRELEADPSTLEQVLKDEIIHLRNADGIELGSMIVQSAKRLDNVDHPLHAATAGGTQPISLGGQGQLVPCTELPDDSGGDVPLVTLHMFKGCERPYVIIISGKWLEDRRDFFYVALTRARIGATVIRVRDG
jgi:hypothetical protein